MNSKRADIQQIQKYLNGELDAKAMHRLEREAQDDPFLMDALEGYALTKNKQEDNLLALQQRLQGRMAVKTRRMIPWTTISIAASVTGFAVVVGLLYKGNQPMQAQKVAISQSLKSRPAVTTAIISDKAAITTPKDEVPQLAYNSPGAPKQYAKVSPKAGVVIPPPVMEANAEPMDVLKKIPDSSAIEDRIMGYLAANRQDTILGGDKIAITNNASALKVLNSKAKGAEMTVRPGKPGDNSAFTLSNAGLPPNLVSGVVLSRLSRSPIPGVTVKLVGKTTATQTDANGKFTLPNVKKNDTVAFGYIGYNSKTFGVQGGDSIKVELDENANSLSEVVVVPAKLKRAKARPETGWDALKKYLYDNAVSPDGKQGTVELAFTVNPDGRLKDIKVIKSLSTAADTKAISLIKEGLTWAGNTNNKAEEVTIKVMFHK